MAHDNDEVVIAPEDDQLRSRLSDALRQGLWASGNTYQGLIDKIEEASNNRPGMTIERRKLHDLLTTRKHVKLSTLELQALDTFFLSAHRGGLSGILKRDNLLQLVATTGRVVFLLGTKPTGKVGGFNNNISSWDLRSVVHIMRVIDSKEPGVQFDMQEVLLRTRSEMPSPNNPLETFSKEEWHELIMQRNGPSIISLGSPRANHGSECIIAAMMGLTPFQNQGVSVAAIERLPFLFAWRPDRIDRVSSRFVADLSDLLGASFSDPNRYYAAIRVEQETVAPKVYTSEHEADVRDEYGVVACQRRHGGRIFMSISGSTGPSTLAGAEVLASASLELPIDDSPLPPVLWLLVKTQVHVHTVAAGDKRHCKTDEKPVAIGVWYPSKLPNRRQ